MKQKKELLLFMNIPTLVLLLLLYSMMQSVKNIKNVFLICINIKDNVKSF